MHYVIPVVVPIAVIIQQNIEQFSKKTQHTGCTSLWKGFVTNWLKRNGIFWVSTASTDADLKMQQGPSLKVKLPMKEAGREAML